MFAPSIAPEQLEEWRKQREQLAAIAKAATDSLQAFERLIRAAAPFVEQPQQQPPLPLPPSSIPISRKSTSKRRVRKFRTMRGVPPVWTVAVMAAVERFSRGASSGELLAEVGKDSGLAARLAESNKGFYSALYKNEERGELVRYKSRFFTPASHRRFMAKVAAGEESDLEESAPHIMSRRPSAAQEKIKELLSRNNLGLTANEMVGILKTDDEVGHSFQKKSGFIYNVLRRLIELGEVEKHGQQYRVPRKPVPFLRRATNEGETRHDVAA